MEQEPTIIKEIGGYLSVDEHGFIVKVASPEKFQETWKPVIEEIKKVYLENFGEKIHSIYIRGSVAKGEAVEGISDVDSFAVVRNKEDEVDESILEGLETQIENKFPFVQGAEMGVISLGRLDNRSSFKMMIKTQAVCIYGEDLSNEIAPYKIDKGLFIHSHNLEKSITSTIKGLEEMQDKSEIEEKCRWIMKNILRSGCEIVITRSQKYTRDLYPCYKVFAEYYPEHEAEMKEVLTLAISPTEDKEKIVEVLERFGSWMIEESKLQNK